MALFYKEEMARTSNILSDSVFFMDSYYQTYTKEKYDFAIYKKYFSLTKTLFEDVLGEMGKLLIAKEEQFESLFSIEETIPELHEPKFEENVFRHVTARRTYADKIAKLSSMNEKMAITKKLISEMLSNVINKSFKVNEILSFIDYELANNYMKYFDRFDLVRN